MENELKICTELEWTNRAESLKVAIEEDPDNIINGDNLTEVNKALAHIDAPLIAVLYKRKWRPRRVLKISFLGNVDNIVKTKIIKYAKQWLEHANLKFDFISGNEGDIRIATMPGGSWSYLGTDAKLIEPSKPTMNFGWLYPNTSDKEYSRVVLHEFGHAIGAIHEHQHPVAGIPWDKPKVYAYYAKLGWDKEQVDQNIFTKYGTNILNMSSYDQKSIMHYAIPNELTVGDWEVEWNTELSSTDKKFIKTQYP